MSLSTFRTDEENVGGKVKRKVKGKKMNLVNLVNLETGNILELATSEKEDDEEKEDWPSTPGEGGRKRENEL
jgi:hypothetical protein